MAAALELDSHYGKALPSLEVEGASERFELWKPRGCRFAKAAVAALREKVGALLLCRSQHFG